MSWTDERVQVLSRLWLEGKSASQIANTLGGGLTRNAVIGKVHRLGLAGRAKPAPATPTTVGNGDCATSRLSQEAAPEPLMNTKRVANRTASHTSHASPQINRVSIQGNTALAIAEAADVEAKSLRIAEEVVVPLSLRVTIVELRESMCKWPIGDPSSADFRYCGSPSHAATPYCSYHGKLAYQPMQERRRDRDKRPMLAR